MSADEQELYNVSIRRTNRSSRMEEVVENNQVTHNLNADLPQSNMLFNDTLFRENNDPDAELCAICTNVL